MPRLRYILAALLIGASLFATPYAINHAYEFRGYSAIGGEYLIIPFGIFLAYILLEAAKGWDKYKTSKRQTLNAGDHVFYKKDGTLRYVKIKDTYWMPSGIRLENSKIGVEE